LATSFQSHSAQNNRKRPPSEVKSALQRPRARRPARRPFIASLRSPPRLSVRTPRWVREASDAWLAASLMILRGFIRADIRF